MENERAVLTATEIRSQIQLIQQVMATVMKDGTHYGVIPGCTKPSLLKAGSETLLTTFRIAVDPEVEDLSVPDLIRYRVRTHGRHQLSGILLGTGVGECSSEEDKYKWRKAINDEEFAETAEDQKRLKWKKYQGKAYKEKQVRTNPFDVANTILKMAKKRSQIDLTLTATAASDIFEQDMEEISEELRDSLTDNQETKPKIKPPQPKTQTEQPAGEQSAAETQTITTGIEKVETKTGTKNGKPWTKYIIHAGETYSTFSKTFADEAQKASESGLVVTLEFKVSTYGNEVVNLKIQEIAGESRSPGEEG